MDESELTDAGIVAHRGIKRVGVVFWTRQSSLILASMHAVGSSEGSVLDETEITNAGVDAHRGIERGSQSWRRQSSLILASMRVVGSGEAVSLG